MEFCFLLTVQLKVSVHAVTLEFRFGFGMLIF